MNTWVRVHTFCLRHTRHAHPMLKHQLPDPALLRHAAMYPLRPLRPYNFPTFHGRIITLQLTTNPVGKIKKITRLRGF